MLYYNHSMGNELTKGRNHETEEFEPLTATGTTTDKRGVKMRFRPKTSSQNLFERTGYYDNYERIFKSEKSCKSI